MTPRSRARKGARPESGVAGTIGRQSTVAGETPRSLDEHADADALALGIRQPLDAPVLRCDELLASYDHARVGILGARPGRGVDRGCTEIPHARHSSKRRDRGYNAPALKRWWRNW
jgi:hypothetical protein